MLVFTLLLATASTGAPAREFRAAHNQNDNNPAVQTQCDTGFPRAGKSGGRLQIRMFLSRQSACQKAQRDPAVAELIERIRKGE